MSTKSRTSTKGKLFLPALFAVVSVLIILFGVVPASQKIVTTRVAIEELKADLKEQKVLRPIFLTLEQRKKKPLPKGISVNELQPLKVADLADLPDVFETLASESDLELISATPQVRSLQDERELLLVDARVRGKFFTFNSLLNRLNDMRFIKSVESFSIDVTDLGAEMSVSVWLAIK